jgi:phage shock protein C
MNDRLYRSVDDRMIGGVCAGVAARLRIDPSIVRVVWALSILPTGFISLAAYLLMWLIVPEAPGGFVSQPARSADHQGVGARPGVSVVIGGTLILLGVWFLVRDMLPVLDPGRLWPVALVVLGIGLVAWAYQRSRHDPTGHRR